MKTIAIDLDGTIAEYHGWNGIEHVGPALPGAVEFTKDLLELGYEVVIFTTRTNVTANREFTLGYLVHLIELWLKENGFDERIKISTDGKPLAMLYIDDRAYSVNPNCSWFYGDAEKLDKLIKERERKDK